MPELEEKAVESLRELALRFVGDREGVSIGKAIGQGASAAVFEMFDAGEQRALKVYSPEFLQGEGGPAELRRLKLQKDLATHQCAQLVQVIDVHFWNPTCLVEMEYVSGVDLDKCLQSIPDDAIPILIGQLAESVSFLEQRGLVHRDIKPSNIRVSPDFQKLKLLDLGVLRELDDAESPDVTAHGMRKPFIATAQYSSPEYLFWLEQPGRDMWRALSLYQVGAVLHDMLTRKALFADEVASGNRYVLAMAVLQKIPPIQSSGSQIRLAALAARCLTKDMHRRLACVNWTDFAPNANRAEGVAQRVMRIRETGLGRPVDSMSALQRSAVRDRLAQSVVQNLHTKMKDQFRGSQLELIDRPGTCRKLRFLLPKTNLAVDTHIDFRWSETAKDETAAVFVRSLLKPREIDDRDDLIFVDICTLTDATEPMVTDALQNHIASSIDIAIDIAEVNGGELPRVVDLNERNP